jgi:hypothetical protein
MPGEKGMGISAQQQIVHRNGKQMGESVAVTRGNQFHALEGERQGLILQTNLAARSSLPQSWWLKAEPRLSFIRWCSVIVWVHCGG